MSFKSNWTFAAASVAYHWSAINNKGNGQLLRTAAGHGNGYWRTEHQPERFYPSLLVPVSSLLSAVALSTRDGAFLSFLDPKAFLTVFLNGDKNIFGCVVLAGS